MRVRGFQLPAHRAWKIAVDTRSAVALIKKAAAGKCGGAPLGGSGALEKQLEVQQGGGSEDFQTRQSNGEGSLANQQKDKVSDRGG